MCRIGLLVGLAFVGAASAWAQPAPVNSALWRLEGEARVVEHMGRPAFHIPPGASVQLPEANFRTGVIEFDMAASAERGFPGLQFRGQDALNYESFYIRPHQSGNPDATQYTPVFNGVPGWQIFVGPGFSSSPRFRANEWMHFRVEVADDSARIFMDGSEVLTIHDLKRDPQAGYLALAAGPFGEAYFSNIVVAAGAPEAAPAAPAATLPNGLIGAWAVSSALEFDQASAIATANRLDELAWTPVAVESNGIANLARVAVWSQEAPATIARVSLSAARSRKVQLRFGFSDAVRVYLNGVLLYEGDDSYRSRDYRFLGTVGFYDALELPLRRGRNELVFVVREAAGGWAAAGAIEDREGLQILAPQ